MNNKQITIEFNQEDLDEYLEYYFKMNPRKRKKPVESPMARSLNKMLVITNRLVQNAHKQNIKDYVIWIVKKYNLNMTGISKADLHINFTFPTKIRHDLDNFIGGTKEFMDGFSEVGLIVDDDYGHIRSISASANHEPRVTKMVFTFNNCEFDLEELKEAQEKELNKKQKREETMANKSKSKKKRTIKK